MIDREKVIKAYEDFVNGYECFCTSDDYEYEMHKAVLALLKEQEAVEPKAIGMNAFGHTVYACGKCGLLITESMNYCHECGKRIIWEGR